MNRILSLFVMLLALSHPALSEIYKWVDESGRVHFSDKDQAEKNAENLEIRVNTSEAVPVVPRKQKVVMYSTENCGYCKQARKYFRQSRIPFEEYDIDKNRQAEKRFRALGGRGTPLIVLGGRTLQGFTVQRFKAFYGQ